MNRLSIIMLALPLLQSCYHHIKDENSQFYRVPIGSSLILNQNLSILPNVARAHIQYGKLVSKKAIDMYYPHCEFEIRTLKETSQTIYPDTFTIYQVDHDIQWSQTDVMVASLSRFDMGMSNEGISLVAYANEYYLESASQPDVFRLTCLHWQEHSNAYHLSINEVRKVLGGIFTLATDSNTP
ncbi:MAG: hypothetical protein OQL06_04890 [Gammaproteobacteria bacterium]|nr:hypothetical protein [Gammaproteobacteria bacterium]